MRFFSPPDPFRRAAMGESTFHPLGRLGPAYVVAEESLRRRLATAARLHWLGNLACLGFFLIWLASYRGPDPLMYVAPPLLAFALVWLTYRLRLRGLLRDVPLASDRRQAGDAPPPGERP